MPVLTVDPSLQVASEELKPSDHRRHWHRSIDPDGHHCGKRQEIPQPEIEADVERDLIFDHRKQRFLPPHVGVVEREPQRLAAQPTFALMPNSNCCGVCARSTTWSP